MEESIPSWLFSEMSFRRCRPAGKMGDACNRFAATLTFILHNCDTKACNVLLCCTSVASNDWGLERSLNAIEVDALWKVPKSSSMQHTG